MIVYINKNISKIYLEFDLELSAEDYSNLGTTWEDYLNGCYVLLNSDLIEFRKLYPHASVKEVFDMKLASTLEESIETVRKRKLSEIDQYDNGPEVNSFTINSTFPAWFTVLERLNYKLSLESAKLLSIDKLSFYINNTKLEVDTSQAELMLANLLIYADTCFMVTKAHKIAVEALDTIEEIKLYDYTVGYPDKLNFDLLIL